ncbi:MULTISPECIES: hypothetical protein [unclassified Maridesulfovibrio]|uniref:hypothetical protein n=1 Tax=unclassified Maridesulfovibrio TaxID=2794999 RepID=UPI003B40C15C
MSRKIIFALFSLMLIIGFAGTALAESNAKTGLLTCHRTSLAPMTIGPVQVAKFFPTSFQDTMTAEEAAKYQSGGREVQDLLDDAGAKQGTVTFKYGYANNRWTVDGDAIMYGQSVRVIYECY